jgi:hypothetical protein
VAVLFLHLRNTKLAGEMHRRIRLQIRLRRACPGRREWLKIRVPFASPVTGVTYQISKIALSVFPQQGIRCHTPYPDLQAFYIGYNYIIRRKRLNKVAAGFKPTLCLKPSFLKIPERIVKIA